MKRISRVICLVSVLFLLVSTSVGSDVAVPCRSIDLSDIEWVASINADENPDTPANHANIIQGTDEHAGYYGMEWNSPAPTDLSLNALDRQDRAGTESIMLILSASEPMQVEIWVSTDSGYCGQDASIAACSLALEVGTEPTTFDLPSSSFDHHPFSSCSDVMSRGDLELIGSIFLFPSATSGELRVYEVALCGEDIEVAIDEPEPVPVVPEIPTFVIDPDVTLDSVVQIGVGPQKLSTDIKFYPNTRRILPGETVYWTLDLGDLEGPFTIVPEMDNDMNREKQIVVRGSSIVIQHRYEKPNLYVPYLRVQLPTGDVRTVWTMNSLHVASPGSGGEGVGLKMPTPSDPYGDVLNAGHLVLVNQDLFSTVSGRDYMASEISHWASTGFNLIIIDVLWFLDDLDSCVLVPIYEGSPQPDFWMGTLDFDEVIWLTEQIHDTGMKVAWRFAPTIKRDHSMIERFEYWPSSLELSVQSQLVTKPVYAALAEDHGVEMFGIDMENDSFTMSRESIEVVSAVKGVFSGPVFDSPFSNRALRSPVSPYLDLILFSTDPHNFSTIESVDQKIGAFRHQYETELLRPLLELQKPGIFQVYADGVADPQSQADAYEAMLGVIEHANSLIQGIDVFDLVLYPGWSNLTWTPMDRPAEQILKEFFNERLPDERFFDFGQKLSPPEPMQVLSSFEESETASYEVGSYNGIAAGAIDPVDPNEGDQSLKVVFRNQKPKDDWANFSITYNYSSPQDWHRFSTLNFWHKNDGNPASILVSIFDSDGDRFVAELWITYEKPGSWMPYTVHLDDLFNPDWHAGGDGKLDLRRVTRLEILEKVHDESDHTSWFDSIYLGGPAASSDSGVSPHDLAVNAPTIDPDVTLDSVVQVGDGPQELSTNIKFYPNTRLILPGETVYWTLDLGDLEGPFTITPEMNNDARREPSISSSESTIMLEYVYEVGAIYVPYVLIRDGNGIDRTIYTKNVLGVIPQLQQREGLGLRIPTLENPVGDFVKGIQVLCLDEVRFSTTDGVNGLKREIAQWADAGINLVMYNIPLFVSSIHSNVTLPFYGDKSPMPFASTWLIQSLVHMTDWAHDQGVRVAFRPFMMTEDDGSGVLRYTYDPLDLMLYLAYHEQIKKLYAEVAEVLGVEMFNIDAENPVTSLNIEALGVVQAVREVYSGVVCDSPTTENGPLYLTPLHQYVDLIYISQGPYFSDLQEAPDLQLEGTFYTQMVNEVLPTLYRYGKPGIIETFVWNTTYMQPTKVTASSIEHQVRGYEAILRFFDQHPSLLMGITLWETSLDDRRYTSGFDPFGHASEDVLSRYFNDVIPDRIEYDFGSPIEPPRIGRVLDGFNTTTTRANFSIYENNGIVEVGTTESENLKGPGALQASFSSSQETNFGMYLLNRDLATPQDWMEFKSFNVWVKADGTQGVFFVEVWDEDGDRFLARVASMALGTEWALITVRLQDLAHPEWAQKGDGQLDLSAIHRWTIGQISYEPTTSFRTLFDEVYLGY